MKKTGMKEETKRALPKYLLFILVSALVGGLLGFFSEMAGINWRDALLGALEQFMPMAARWGIPVCLLILCLPALLLYLHCKSKFTSWDGEDENVSEQIERLLSWSLLLASLTMIAALFLLSVGLVYLRGMSLLLNAGEMLLALILTTILEQKIIELTRTMNPEKQGTVYDLDFHKKWLNSCDEAERQQMGEAAYRTFMFTSNCCVVLWLLLMVTHTCFGTGLLPIFVVLLIWSAMLIRYTLETIKLSKHRPIP